MKKISKRLSQQNQLISKDQPYEINSAINLLKTCANAKFSETAEAHIRLNIDPKYNDQQLRATLILPKGTGKTLTVAVLVGQNDIETYKNSGADIIGSEDLIEQIVSEQVKFDVLITTPDQMPKLAKLGKILGPKGLMPSPKSGTVTKNINEAVSQFKKGKLEYRADRTGIVHIPFGKMNFSIENLEENLNAVYNSIEKNRPTGVKGKYFKSFYICSTMGPSIPILLSSFK